MRKLKKATIKDLERIIPKSDWTYIKRDNTFLELDRQKPLIKRDDSLIELEIAFRKCKRVGVFD